MSPVSKGEVDLPDIVDGAIEVHDPIGITVTIDQLQITCLGKVGGRTWPYRGKRQTRPIVRLVLIS